MNEKGGVTINVLECIFNGAESITSFNMEFEEGLYEALPNLYAVCIADNPCNPRKIVGGFFVKTSYTAEDKEFHDALQGIIQVSPNLSHFIGPRTRLLTARLGVKGSAPLSEQEMLRLMATQYLKFSTAGSA